MHRRRPGHRYHLRAPRLNPNRSQPTTQRGVGTPPAPRFWLHFLRHRKPESLEPPKPAVERDQLAIDAYRECGQVSICQVAVSRLNAVCEGFKVHPCIFGARELTSARRRPQCITNSSAASSVTGVCMILRLVLSRTNPIRTMSRRPRVCSSLLRPAEARPSRRDGSASRPRTHTSARWARESASSLAASLDPVCLVQMLQRARESPWLDVL